MMLRELIASFLLAITLIPSTLFAQPEDSEPSRQLVEVATNAQNSREYEFAAKKWEQFISENPNSKLLAGARMNCGICYSMMLQHAKAAEKLQAALPGLTDTAVQQPRAKLYLGYSLLKLGIDAKDGNQSEKANEYLTTASNVLGKAFEAHPKFSEATQLAYFQAQAFEELDQLEQALTAYRQSIKTNTDDSTSRFNALFAIGDLLAELGRHDEAVDAYEAFRTQANATGGHPSLRDVTYAQTTTRIRLADAKANQGENESAQQLYRQISDLLKQLEADYPQDENARPDFDVADVQYNRAYCLNRLGQYADSGELYALLGKQSDFRYAKQSLAYAGNNFFEAKDYDKAIPLLKQASEATNAYSANAAHLLAQIYLERKQFQEAYDAAAKFAGQVEKEDLKVLLMMDQADAAYEIEPRRKEALDLFAAVADNHADHPNASTARYNEAFTALKLGDPQRTINAADKFLASFQNDAKLVDLTADAMALKGEALLETEKFSDAAAVYAQLLGQTGIDSNSNQKRWSIRAAVAQYLAGNFDQAIATLKPIQANLQGKDKAEAAHWLGLSHVALNQFSEAEQALESSRVASEQWTRADESLAFLIRSQLAQKQRDAAAANVNLLADEYPKSKWLSDVYFRLGTFDLDEAKNYQQALANFNTVINRYPQSLQLPPSLYGAALSQFELKKLGESEKLFARLINEFPDHELAENARMQRASVLRMTGDTGASITELKQLLETDLKPQERSDALYGLGLAQVAQKQWGEAIKSFETLISTASKDERLDRFYYELAWAQRENKNERAALDAFAKIAKDLPNSEFAARAHFQVASAAYASGEYDAAAKAFVICLATEADDALHEKAAYKLAWCYYKQNQYDEAQQAFTKQVGQFAKGDLFADGIFMLAESLFRQKKYDEALAAYEKAKPVVAASTVVDPKLNWLAMLHGAQSANKSKKYQAAIDLAKGIDETQADMSLKQDVWLEVGTAHSGLKVYDKAVEYWRKAAVGNQSKTGARALCMIGDQHFREKEFEMATDQFKEVFFGFGGKDASEDIRPWQAYALYETARCYYVQIKDAPDAQKARLMDKAIEYFQRLLDDYPKDSLAPEAQRQLKALKGERAKLAG